MVSLSGEGTSGPADESVSRLGSDFEVSRKPQFGNPCWPPDKLAHPLGDVSRSLQCKPSDSAY
jgi:hypothetical protein